MKFFFTLASFVVIVSAANATVRTVTCQNTPSHFLPVTVNAFVGDTIHWTWVAGDHVVGPINASYIPGGAAMWNAPIDVSHLTFDYVVTVAGNYHYVCHPATPHGEDAFIVVTLATGVQQNSALSNLSFVYPNPSTGKFSLSSDIIPATEGREITIYNSFGERVYQSVISNSSSDIDLSNKAKGIYFIKIYSGQSILTKKIVIQ